MYGLGGLEPKRTSGRRLGLFQLKTEDEKAALRMLRTQRGGQRSFERLVLGKLALIAESVSIARDKKQSQPRRPKPSKMLRDLERRTKSVRLFAERMEEPLLATVPLARLFEPSSQTLVREARRYAKALENAAKSLKPRASEGAYSLAITPMPHHNGPPRNPPRPETRLMSELAWLVRQKTGENNWEPLAVLLQRPTGIQFSGDTLRKHVNYERKRANSRPRRALLAFRRPTA